MLSSDLFSPSSDAFMLGMLILEVEIAQSLGKKNLPGFYAEPLFGIEPKKQKVIKFWVCYVYFDV